MHSNHPPLPAIRSARSQAKLGRDAEQVDDLPMALTSYTMAAKLAQFAMGSREFKEEGADGLVHQEIREFIQNEGRDLVERTRSLEAKMAQLELNAQRNSPVDEPVQKTAGGSISDRVRALESAGMAVGSTSKRLSRELSAPTSLTPAPMSARIPLFVPPPPVSHSATLAASAAGLSSPTSARAFVPLSALAPPSPAATPVPSSSEFRVAFPSIAEFEEDQLRVNGRTNGGTYEGGGAHAREGADAYERAAKAFPVLPLDPAPRPASTPAPALHDLLASRPTSPSRSPARSPLAPQPALPSTPTTHLSSMLPPASTSIVSASTSASTPSTSTARAPPRPEKPDLPKGSVTPAELRRLLAHSAAQILLIDVRERVEFERAHIGGPPCVCVEPSVLARPGITSDAVEDALSIAPTLELTLFKNRDKFDLVVLYDGSSELAARNSPITVLSSVIWEREFRRPTRNMPAALIGGFDAWRRDGGTITGLDAELDSGSSSARDTGLSPSSSRDAEWEREERERREREREEAVVMRTYVNGRTRSTTDSAAGRPPVPEATRPMTLAENQISSPPMSPSFPSTPITYPLLSRQPTGPSAFSSTSIAPPPQASINPSPLTRRRSDFIDQSAAVVAPLPKGSVDYPALEIRPPPVAASSGMERMDRAVPQPTAAVHHHSIAPMPPTISSDYPVLYWGDMHIGMSGLKNMGNTCYMNATIQCLSATSPFAQFFRDGSWSKAVNMLNPLGTKGAIAEAFSTLVRDMWNGQMPYITPFAFRKKICNHASQFGGSEQHDSQEFLSFLMDGLHEDLNRILHKPHHEPTSEEEAELERMPQQVASRREWAIYRMRNDSIVVDYFQGQFRNRLECLTCNRTSTTYNTFMYLSLPIPSKISKVSLYQCLDAFVAEEVLEKSDAWFCPQCKCKRKAKKQLSLSRLPPVLLIHLKRFSIKTHFTDKLDKLVEFPLKGLDLTNYMPMPLPPGADRGQDVVATDDPRTQMPPYRYDLYGVTNHFGSLSSGHYTAFVASRGQWLYCDDSRVAPSDAKDVVGRPAYVLYYKRVKT
ncbi:hypothetical protein K488DRAFT_76118 [Vararia minispora EC-137]|uniref:Uncharacterized protein n=1 Tax=Vararia minispora EC-137 TaxID=1314806 RepID=A0ACB8QXD7_9AGAM|nr:hypothetical protein K488DRAFT_76118 [Vararia minispora EC-137]